VALDASSVPGAVDASSKPLGPGFVTRYGIFVRSGDGLRRYDKSLDAFSNVLVTGQVGEGTAVGQVADDRALYVSSVNSAGDINLFRVEDTLVPAVTQLNTAAEGALKPMGFRVLKSSVLYATVNSSAWTNWNKGTGARTEVLDGHNIVLASTVHDRVFTKFIDADGNVQLAQSLADGSERRTFGDRDVLSAGLADTVSPYARHLSLNASYSHALMVLPTTSGSELRWLSFDAPASDVVAGAVPAGLSLDAAPDWKAPSIVGAQTLVGVRKAGTAASRYLFVAGRSPGSLVRAADGL
jgi:hypothetical protein